MRTRIALITLQPRPPAHLAAEREALVAVELDHRQALVLDRAARCSVELARSRTRRRARGGGVAPRRSRPRHRSRSACGLPSQWFSPIAHAPSRAACSASSSRVIPQNLTRILRTGWQAALRGRRAGVRVRWALVERDRLGPLARRPAAGSARSRRRARASRPRRSLRPCPTNGSPSTSTMTSPPARTRCPSTAHRGVSGLDPGIVRGRVRDDRLHERARVRPRG